MLQADLAEQRDAAAAAESRAASTAEEAAQLRAELQAARSAPQQQQSADEAPAVHAAANGHAENGAVSAEEQVMDQRCCIDDIRAVCWNARPSNCCHVRS